MPLTQPCSWFFLTGSRRAEGRGQRAEGRGQRADTKKSAAKVKAYSSLPLISSSPATQAQVPAAKLPGIFQTMKVPVRLPHAILAISPSFSPAGTVPASLPQVPAALSHTILAVSPSFPPAGMVPASVSQVPAAFPQVPAPAGKFRPQRGSSGPSGEVPAPAGKFRPQRGSSGSSGEVPAPAGKFRPQRDTEIAIEGGTPRSADGLEGHPPRMNPPAIVNHCSTTVQPLFNCHINH